MLDQQLRLMHVRRRVIDEIKEALRAEDMPSARARIMEIRKQVGERDMAALRDQLIRRRISAGELMPNIREALTRARK